MIITETTLIICTLVVLFATLTPLLNPFFRRIDFNKSKDLTAELPPVAIIITVHDNTADLSKHLPLFLNQDYPALFQVIIVTEKNDSTTENILKQYSHDKHLYVTFIPESSRYMSRKKLAITLGVKASKCEWNILTEASCKPQSNKWLESMAQNFTQAYNLVIGYSNYLPNNNTYERFEHLRTFYYLIQRAQKQIAYRTNGTNLAFKKSDFISGDGFRGNLHTTRGEYDFLVNKYAEKNRTAVELRPQAWIKEDYPTKQIWQSRYLFYLNSRKFLKRSPSFRALFNTDMVAMFANYLLILVATAYAVSQHNYILLVVAVLSMLITLILRIYIARKALLKFNEQIPSLKIILFECQIIFSNLSYFLKYKKADKNEFTTHKL